MEQVTNPTLRSIEAILEHYADQKEDILLTIVHLQMLHNRDINTHGLQENNERYQNGIEFLYHLALTITQ